MTNKTILFCVFIFSGFIYVFIGGLENIERKSFEAFYSSKPDLNFQNNLNKRIDNLLKIKSNTPSQLNLLATQLLADGRYSESSKVFNFYIGTYSDFVDSDIYSSFAESSYLNNKMKFNNNIVSLLDKSLFLDPSNHKALTMKGLFNFENGKFNDALKNWAIALENVDSDDQKKSLIIVMNSALKEIEINKNKNTN